MLAHDYILEMGHEVELSLTREEDSHHPQDPDSDRPVDQEPHQQLQQDSGQHLEIEGSLLCLADFILVILVPVPTGAGLHYSKLYQLAKNRTDYCKRSFRKILGPHAQQ